MYTIGVYDWDGINSIPAEMFLLPLWSPLHPGKYFILSTVHPYIGIGGIFLGVANGVVCNCLSGKLWCHARMVYLPMCYLYCMRFVPDQVKTGNTLLSVIAPPCTPSCLMVTCYRSTDPIVAGRAICSTLQWD